MTMHGFALRLPLVLGLCLTLLACGGKSTLKTGDEALGLTPDDSPAKLYVDLAKEYHRLGQTEVALRRAQQAVKTDDKYAPAHVWLAFLLEQLQQTDEAAKHYERAVKIAPNNPDVLNAYGSFLCNQRRYAEADAQFVKAAKNPVYATPWIALTNAGNCAVEAGDTTKAETHYRAAIQSNAGFGAPLASLGELAMRRGDAKAAKDYIDRYFKPETVRTPAASRIALQVGIEAERALGNRKRAAFYQDVLHKSFPNTPAGRSP
ncbi:type IV pilus biogenesis/stability protein PilW [Allochromatium tepidum]|uniref:Type IV pilus biogenesis/stability protein PilW n=1 Tax=Allochromatium tepidum TaxID=553982 RepID=A0ABM7QK19_9GAMM|nr:type IV pilus biogenesis/stability protein PilW [Allochromatium tepidum]BCU06068.1 type IV pilus biogenesis/stability protein PilW [Allochromatium tepidum]